MTLGDQAIICPHVARHMVRLVGALEVLVAARRHLRSRACIAARIW